MGIHQNVKFENWISLWINASGMDLELKIMYVNDMMR